jgi:hypothetical protein
MFLKVINENWEKLEETGACLKCWQLLDKSLLEHHMKNGHPVAVASNFSTREQYLDICRDNGKTNTEKSLVCLFDLMQIKHLLPNMEECVKEYNQKNSPKTPVKPQDQVKDVTLVPTQSPTQSPVPTAPAPSNFPKEKATIEYSTPTKASLELEFFKSKSWDMLDDMHKKLENTFKNAWFKLITAIGSKCISEYLPKSLFNKANWVFYVLGWIVWEEFGRKEVKQGKSRERSKKSREGCKKSN